MILIALRVVKTWPTMGSITEKDETTPLRIFPVPFHMLRTVVFTNPDVSGDPAVTSAFFGGLNDFGSDLD